MIKDTIMENHNTVEKATESNEINSTSEALQSILERQELLANDKCDLNTYSYRYV